MKVKEESEKVDLKLNIQKLRSWRLSHHFMANRRGKSGSSGSNRFYFLGLQNPVDGNCSHKIKRCLLVGRKVMTNLNSVLKSRDINLQAKFCILKALVFPIVMYRCESWTWKKAECQRSDAFELWCWRRRLRVSWTARKSPVHPKGNQSWTFIGRTDAKAEASIL